MWEWDLQDVIGKLRSKNNMNNNTLYLVKDNLEVEVYVIGYKAIGESIILFVKMDHVIIFSAVIDSYQYNRENRTIDILKENNIDKINYLCWTHPDDDHSKGMIDIIYNFVDENTLINIPAKIDINKEKCSKSTREIFKELQQNIRTRDKYKVFEVSNIMNILGYEDPLKIYYNLYEYNLEIKALAPNSNISWHEQNRNQFYKNLHSIAFILSFGEKNFLFTGDIEDVVIKSIPSRHFPEKIDLLKIPHHGSKSSTKLLEYLRDVDIACVTAYKVGKSNNPEIEVVDRYNKISKHVFSTYDIEEKNNDENFGIVKINFDILKNTYNQNFYGNGCEISHIRLWYYGININ